MMVSKKVLSVFMAVVLALGMMPLPAFAEGSTNYTISDEASFKAFRDAVNAGETSADTTAVVTRDFSVTLGSSNLPVGTINVNEATLTPVNPFIGTFDGQNHTITVNIGSMHDGSSVKTQLPAGLFGVVGNGGVVKNLIVKGQVKDTGNTSSSQVTGAAAGVVGILAGGTVENVANYASVSTTPAHTDNAENVWGVGGIVGYGYGTIKNCANHANITAKNNPWAAGILGQARSTGTVSIENCYNVGKVETGAYKLSYNFSIAGIANSYGGSSNIISISNSYNAGAVVWDSTNAGPCYGLVDKTAGTISDSYYPSDLTAPSQGAGATAKTAADMAADDFVTTLGSAFAKSTLNNQTTPMLQWESGVTVPPSTQVAKPNKPTITSDPADTSKLAKGAQVTLTASTVTYANGETGAKGTTSYQWYKENGTKIEGATGQTYTPNTASFGRVTYYVCAINTVAGASPVASEASASVVVNVPDPNSGNYNDSEDYGSELGGNTGGNTGGGNAGGNSDSNGNNNSGNTGSGSGGAGQQEKVQVTFNADNGTEPTQLQVNKNTTVTPPTNPTKAGYVFEGWYAGSSKYDFSSPVTAALTLVGHWTLDTKTLTATIAAAEAELAKVGAGDVVVGDDAREIASGKPYVTSAQKKELEDKLAAAKAAKPSTAEEVKSASEALAIATGLFQAAYGSQTGTKAEDSKDANGTSEDNPSDSTNKPDPNKQPNSGNVTSGDATMVAEISADGAARVTKALSVGTTLKVSSVKTADGSKVKVTAIAASAFANMKSLKSATVGNSVVKVGKGAFKGCTKLTAMTLGKNVKSVGASVFKGDKKLTTLKISSTQLSKTSCKNMLKGSSVKTIKLTGMTKAQKKTVIAKYSKWFPKKVAGKKLVIK